MSDFSDRVLNWYALNARVLPWRGLSDPYAVWVSEIMLQQTQVETVIPYFHKWMKLFPTVTALAMATEQSVLSAWEGMGYYSRVRNLYKAARVVVENYQGRIPGEFDQLIKLPGVGKYTASAISSIAFSADIAAIDGNIRRVFTRVFDVSSAVDKPAGEKILWDLAQENVPSGRAGDYNQALMDLGASICIPRKPLCELCPFLTICKSVDNPESRPVLSPKKKVPHKIKMAAVIMHQDNVLLFLRPSKGLLGGMWEFPAVEINEKGISASSEFAVKLSETYNINIVPGEIILEVRHAYTHFTVNETAVMCTLIGENTGTLEWIRSGELKHIPMGKIDRSISQAV
ncbi:MAG: A/G-specific adenine glycosylase [Chloroflexota bacterium]